MITDIFDCQPKFWILAKFFFLVSFYVLMEQDTKSVIIKKKPWQSYLAAQPCSTMFLLFTCGIMKIIFLVEHSRQSCVEEISQLSPYRHPSFSDTILLWTIATGTSMVETTNKFMKTTPGITDSHYFNNSIMDTYGPI